MQDPIDLVIRAFNPKEESLGEREQLLAIDARSGKLVKPSGLFSGLGRTVHYYAISSTRRAIRRGLPVELSTFDGDIKVLADYEVACLEGHERLLVSRVYSYPSPQKALDAFIEGKIQEAVRSYGVQRFIRDFNSVLPQTEQWVSDHARAALGLMVQLRIKPANDAPKPIEIPPYTLKIRPRDADLSLDITFEGTLAILRGSELCAHGQATNEEDLRQQIIVQAETFLSTEVGIHEIFSGIRRELPERFASFASQLLARHGRCLASPAFRCKFSEQSPYLRAAADSSENHYSFPYSNPNYPNTIKVQASYNLKLVDIQKFITAQIVDLKAWMDALVESKSRELLFQVSHRELCNNFQRTKRQLHERVQVEVERIGYRLEQFYTITDHQLDQLMTGAEIEPIEGSYVLKESGQVQGRLRTVLQVRLNGVEKVVERVARNEAIIDQISKTVNREVVSYLRRTTAEDFYMFFDFPNPTESQGDALQPSVRERLEAVICEALKETYDAEIMLLDFTPLETEVHQRHKRLTKEVHMARVVVQPAGALPETFQFEYRVLCVAPAAWQIFHSSEPEVEKVSQMLQRELSSKLAYFEPLELRQTTKRVYDAASELARERALKDFGLMIEAENFVRLSSRVEEERTSAIQDTKLLEIQNRAEERSAALALSKVERSAREKRVSELWKRAESFEARAQELRLKEDDDEAENLEQMAKKLRQEASAIAQEAMKTGMGKLLEYSEALGEGASAFAVLPKSSGDASLPLGGRDGGPPKRLETAE